MLYFLLIIFLIFLDLYSKNLAYNFLQKKTNIFSDFLYPKYTENTWIAFSIPIEWILLKIITIFLIILLIFYFYKYELKKKNFFINFSFSLIIAWAIWNAYERIFNSKVIDFIGVKYFSIFNLADIFITIWALIYLYFLFKENTKKYKFVKK